MKGYRVTVRSGPRVEREDYDDRHQALAALERHAREIERTADARTVGGRLVRRLDPVHQVVGRVEISGPGRFQGGVDVRGDSSTEAFVGRLRRSVVPQRDGETPYSALRRALET